MRRSQLFVPGNDEKKITKALGLAADSIIFDLEDAVPPSEKSSARNTLKNLLDSAKWEKRKELCVRINSSSTPYWRDDLSSFRDFNPITTLVIPKADQDFLRQIQDTLAGSKELIPLIETSSAFLRMEDIARIKGVTGIGFGAGDFAHSVQGTVSGYTRNVHVKTQLAIVARAYGIDPIDNVYFELANLEGFESEAQFSRELGFAGKQVIHPTQIGAANDIFSPSVEEIEEARKIMEEYEKAESQKIGAIRLDEKLVDAVHYRQAKELLEKKKRMDEMSKPDF